MLIRLEFRNKFIAAGDSLDSLGGDTHTRETDGGKVSGECALLVTSQNILFRF